MRARTTTRPGGLWKPHLPARRASARTWATHRARHPDASGIARRARRLPTAHRALRSRGVQRPFGLWRGEVRRGAEPLVTRTMARDVGRRPAPSRNRPACVTDTASRSATHRHRDETLAAHATGTACRATIRSAAAARGNQTRRPGRGISPMAYFSPYSATAFSSAKRDFERARLLRRPGAEPRGPRAGRVIGIRLGIADGLDRRPRRAPTGPGIFQWKHSAALRIGGEFLALAALEVGVEHEAARIDALEQHHPRRGKAIRRGGRQADRVRVVRLGRRGLGHPGLEQGDRVVGGGAGPCGYSGGVAAAAEGAWHLPVSRLQRRAAPQGGGTSCSCPGAMAPPVVRQQPDGPQQ